MNAPITVVMYHFVRDLKNSKYPEIKALNLDLFHEQIIYLKKNYNFITTDQLLENDLPKNPILLTFDDGYIDGYTNVFPLLKKYNIQGVFAPVVDAVVNYQVLDVNKIHFILASVENKQIIIDQIHQFIQKHEEIYGLKPLKYYQQNMPYSRFDSKEIVYIKTLLQSRLPKNVRSYLCDWLFKKYITTDEQSFSQDLYIQKPQLAEMADAGMALGIHGKTHSWLGYMSKQEQKKEIEESISFLHSIAQNELICVYPYGSYNQDTLKILKQNDIKKAFTTHVDLYSHNNYSSLEMPRIDANDILKIQHK